MWDYVQVVLGLSSMVWLFNPPKWEEAFTRLQVMVGGKWDICLADGFKTMMWRKMVLYVD